MEAVATLITAIAALMWPIVALTAILLFKDEIRGFIKRLRRGKLPGGAEVELDRLENLTESTEREVEALPPAPSREPKFHDEEEDILHLARTKPRLALMELSAKVELAARDLYEQSFGDQGGRPTPFHRMIRRLETEEGVDLGIISESVYEFRSVRNKVVHGIDEDITESEIDRALDLGLRLLRALNRLLAQDE